LYFPHGGQLSPTVLRYERVKVPKEISWKNSSDQLLRAPCHMGQTTEETFPRRVNFQMRVAFGCFSFRPQELQNWLIT
jgi:hypothetical protein